MRTYVCACARVAGRAEEDPGAKARRKAERNVYMKRPSADAVTRDSAHRPKERLPSLCFFPKLQPYASPDLVSPTRARHWNALDALHVCAAGRFFDIKRVREPEGSGRHRDVNGSMDEQGKQRRDQRDHPRSWMLTLIIHFARRHLFICLFSYLLERRQKKNHWNIRVILFKRIELLDDRRVNSCSICRITNC